MLKTSILLASVAACASADEPAPRTPAAPSTLQSVAEHEIDATIAAHHASGAVAIVLDAKSGDVLAVAARGIDPHAARVTGSTMKPFTFAAALEAGIAPTTRIDCENGTRDLGGILAVSSNACTAKLAEPLGDRLAESLHRYHLTALTHVDTRSPEGGAIAAGESLAVAPLDLAASYTAFADHGTYHAAGASERVMSEQTAASVLALMERVVTDPDGTGHAAAIAGVRVAGKTGTAPSGAGNYASFVGIVPADAPRFVVLVGVDGVAESGGKVAAPAFAAIATKALAR